MTRITAWLLALAAALAPGVPSPRAQENKEPPSAQALVQPQILKLPMKGGGFFGGDVAMAAHFYKPQGDGPFPAVVFSHGRAADREVRATLKYPVLVGHGNFWLRKGFALIAPLRRGYGETGGVDSEASGATWRLGSCRTDPDYAKVAKIAGEAVLATLDWAREQPWAAKDKILLVGQSVGGLTTVAVAAGNPPGVVGAINFSGGAGGSPDDSPGRSCKPENLTKLFEEFGKTIRIPSLWLYAENDLFWGAEAPKEWHRAFSAGGSKTRSVMTPPVPGVKDGHALLASGGRLWSPPVNDFVKQLGF